MATYKEDTLHVVTVRVSGAVAFVVLILLFLLAMSVSSMRVVLSVVL